jgi:hypothetical protein
MTDFRNRIVLEYSEFQYDKIVHRNLISKFEEEDYCDDFNY